MQADQPASVERPEEQARVPRLFAAMANRNYRWYWLCAGFSSMGMTIGMLTQGWLVLEITNSPLWVGLVAGLMGMGHVGFGLIGGVVVDRWDKRKVLIAVQSLSGLVAMAVALLIFTDRLELWHLAVSAVLQGVLMAVRLPSGNSMVYLMVGRKVILNALASQHIALNLSRIVGSVVAGTSIESLGVQYAYLFMAFSAWLGGLMVVMVRGDYRSLGTVEPFWRSAVEGLRYAWSSAPIRSLLLMSVLMEMFGFSFLVMLPVMARDVLGVGATGLGYLSAANAVGATVSTVIVAGLGDFKNKQALLLFTAMGAGLSILLFALSPWFAVSLALSVMVGATLMSYDAAMGTMLQLLTTDAVRGRVLGLYGLTFGFTPLGGFIQGVVASVYSAPLAVGMGGAVIVGYVIGMRRFLARRIREALE